MSSEWTCLQIRDLGRIVTGKTPATSRLDYFGGDIPFLTPTDMVDGMKTVVASRTLTEAGLATVKNCLIPKGISVSCIGWQMGKSVLVSKPTVTNQQINTLVVDESRFDMSFAYYLLTSMRKQIFELGATPTRTPIVNKSTFGQIPVRVPQLNEQREIANFFTALDDSIALLRETNATLEAIAQAVFKSWFVDFDPVRAKQEGRMPEGMDEATAALFPDGFDEASVVPLPRGWRLDNLGNWVTVLETGRRPKGGVGAIEEGIPSIGAESITRIGQFDFSKTKYVTSEFFEKMKSGALESHDVLLYKDGGKPGVFLPRVSMFGDGFPFETCGINEHVFRIRLKPPFNQMFLYFWLWSDAIMHELKHRGGKAAIPGINQGDVKEQHLLVPTEDVLRKYDELSAPLVSLLFSNAKRIATLSSLRDMLLPRLISGRIRLPEAEALVA
ncbi:restriction endonuclease subunit S [Burkholderia ubonensis]|uniref:restriction endonuclease subunit S n=1 Tax=Burkholderia ubonensis TaxID=101571 RepID=UPI000BA6F7B2|nr:restriction endonuclease subunit S [Burkholderia ubonensis]PAJ91383.1 hypothetical protein CJO69_27640 [Burkholderia ubonensis]RQP65230.1 restriction endonuclease subunit S [Burkholderia ubonensis]